MKYLDRFIQRLRVQKALQYIPPNSSVLDIGCSDGILFKMAGQRIRKGVGIDPCLDSTVSGKNYQLIPGYFPDALPKKEKFDAITMLAVFEHMDHLTQKRIAGIVQDFLNDPGTLILTIPSQATDKILSMMHAVHLIDGMALEEHHGFKPEDIPALFKNTSLHLNTAKKFELGLNNLFVYQTKFI